eukprot:comp16453_c0_seq1/m.26340 comp16453_c0_seq1/g.26340  ORF comp16453_c0_seq1/g.26340 comp16453_c0_seq1/m.26340 type:complete len:103 (-) comp16453_c0_seq1:233-541(-)
MWNSFRFFVFSGFFFAGNHTAFFLQNRPFSRFHNNPFSVFFVAFFVCFFIRTIQLRKKYFFFRIFICYICLIDFFSASSIITKSNDVCFCIFNHFPSFIFID